MTDALKAITATVAELEAEREAARPIVEDLRIRGIRSAWDHETPREWRTAGFVEELTKTAYKTHEVHPGESLSLAQLALAIATSIPDSAYARPVKSRLVGNAWKEVGRAHYHRNEYEESLRAYDAATRSYRCDVTLYHEELAILVTKAGLLAVIGRSAEASELLDQAGPVLAAFGDRRRATQVELIRAMIEHVQGNLHSARLAYEKLLEKTEDFNDKHSVGALWKNLGTVYNVLGEFDLALREYERSRRVFEEIGLLTEVHRANWGIANVHINRGNYAEGISALRQIREAYLEREMPRDAGEAGLDIVDGLVAQGNYGEALRLVEKIVDEFTRAKLGDHALSALAYLRDLISTAPDRRRVVRHVRAFLSQSRNDPTRLFLPLPPDDFTNTKKS